MTGHQVNPATAVNLMGEPAQSIDILSVVRSTGIAEDRIRVVDPVDIEAMDAALDDAIKAEGPFIIITKRPCVLIKEVAKPMQESTARLTRRNAKSARRV